MSILKDSESSKKIDCVINIVETASRLIMHAINILNLSVFESLQAKFVSLVINFYCNLRPNALSMRIDNFKNEFLASLNHLDNSIEL